MSQLSLLLLILLLLTPTTQAQIAIRAKTLHTMAGPTLNNAHIIITNGKFAAVGPASQTPIPPNYQIIDAPVVTPGLIDAHSVVGLAGQFNNDHDQDQLERSKPIQPELRAIDAYNPRERLIAWVRSFGVTTLHTGHGPGELISGQTIILKTTGNTVDTNLLQSPATLAATLSESAIKTDKKSPGNRSKLVAMLRQALIEASEYRTKQNNPDPEKHPDRKLDQDTLVQVLDRKLPLLVTAHRAQDIASALRIAEEFNINIILDGAAEAYLLIDQIKAANTPVILHPTMKRAQGEAQNLSFTTASKLIQAGIPTALQSGYESYVPKTRVVLFEAALAAANGLTFNQALATITIDAAKILNIQNRVGSIAPGKDADLALFDGDPFEYTTHCITTIINGQIVSDQPR